MRKINIQDFNTQNQQSMNDDPFDLKGAIAGVANVNHQRNLYDCAQSLVSCFAKYQLDQYFLTLDMLPESELDELVRLYVEFTDRELTECVNGTDFSIENDYTCALLAMLKDNNAETRTIFADTVRRNMLAYYSDSLQKLLDEACDSYLRDELNEQGYFAQYDLDHGDVVWSKY
jgi:hypothetical protein